MKIKITGTRIKRVLSYADSATPQDILNNMASTLNNPDLLTAVSGLLEKTDFPVSAFSTEPDPKRQEFIVTCIKGSSHELVKYLLKTKVVSPNFVAKDGTPLLLIAVSRGCKMTSLLLSHGAKIFVDSRLIANKVTGHGLRWFTHYTSSATIMNILLQQHHSITNYEDQTEVIDWALDQHRKHIDFSVFLHRVDDIKTIPVLLRKRILLNLIVTAHKDTNTYMYWASGLSTEDLRVLMETASCHKSLVAYQNMCYLWPKLALHKQQKNIFLFTNNKKTFFE